MQVDVKYDTYSIPEEILNSLLHVIGIYIAVIFSTLICQEVSVASDFSWYRMIGALTYGISSVMMFTMSSAYHCIQYVPAKRILKMLDHIAIYFAIAGMNTPLCLMLRDSGHWVIGIGVLAFQWSFVIIGTFFKIATLGRYRLISTGLYLILGWACAITAIPLIYNSALTSTETSYIITSGLLYTIGSIFYSIKSIKYFHSIWHVFVLVASIFHFMFMLELFN